MNGIYVQTKEEVLEKMISLIPEGSKVGTGGSLSLDQIGVKDVLRNGISALSTVTCLGLVKKNLIRCEGKVCTPTYS